MKKVLFCVLLGSLALGLVVASPAREDLVRIEILSPAQAKDLDRLGVTVNEVARDHCIAEASPELLARVSALGYKYTTLVENINRVYYENSLTKSPLGQYLTYAQFRDSMGTIAVNNPTICKLETLGLSANGNLVTIRHANGYETFYAHLQSIAPGVRPGARIRQKQTVGTVGSTGRSTGPHLHYAMTRRGAYVNPFAQKFPPDKPIPASEQETFQQAISPLLQQMDQVTIPDDVSAAFGNLKG